ncbi:IMP dehydrogenase family protein [Gloeomargarita lithophora Alchichica-D10]|uniref:IMP dehydrogenase family protein n=1 Tax=Gloeomargarita lithophora Alchichica-D10 TaxID=1188229 RepID=A0A1J0A951_9CYAN|nr:IMP dehydrogenase [Gloeomargarita lithophora]APB32447.1 IMP dehydrogenase family protein [Gloeomargarita lithophora Alchichica-D10]
MEASIPVGRGKLARRAYGIDEIALVPGSGTLDPALADTTWSVGGIGREIPIIASAMDGVVDGSVVVTLTELGALGVLNLEGLQTRYETPTPVLERITQVGNEEFVGLMQQLYQEPIKPELVTARIQEIKQRGGIAAVSSTPGRATTLGPLAAAAGADLFFVQATVVSTAHLAVPGVESLDLHRFCQELPIPVVLGNCVTYGVALNLMKAGAAAILVGIGPGAACTSRGCWAWGCPRQRRWPTVPPPGRTTRCKPVATSPSLPMGVWSPVVIFVRPLPAVPMG